MPNLARSWRKHLILEYQIPKYDGDLGSPNLFSPFPRATPASRHQPIKRWNTMFLRQRWFRALLAIAVLGIASGVLLRKQILRAAGWALVADDSIGPADIIVVASDADGAGVVEAADLVQAGVATRVAVFADPPDSVDAEFIRRGIAYEDVAARSTRQLRALGVKFIEQIPRAVAGSQDEGRVLPEWCDQHRFRSIVVVSTADHSRRLRRLLRRSMKGHQTRVTVRPARYSQFDPDRWWETREGTRTQVIEFEKLFLDVVLHPIS
jgi:hypothetical protein